MSLRPHKGDYLANKTKGVLGSKDRKRQQKLLIAKGPIPLSHQQRKDKGKMFTQQLPNTATTKMYTSSRAKRITSTFTNRKKSSLIRYTNETANTWSSTHVFINMFVYFLCPPKVGYLVTIVTGEYKSLCIYCVKLVRFQDESYQNI